MSLLSLLMALIIERLRTRSGRWLWQQSLQAWLARWQHYGALAQFALVVGLPTLLTLYLQYAVQGLWFGLFSLLLWLAVPLLTLGCPPLQQAYRDYLSAASSGNAQACDAFYLRLQQLAPMHRTCDSRQAVAIGQHLMWLNYRYYFAIVFFFTLFGPWGAVFYASCRELHVAKEGQMPLISKLIHGLDWLPSRLLALCYMLVGHLPRALPLWLESLGDVRSSNGVWLGRIAEAAEDVSPTGPALCVETACRFVSLAKRAILLSLVLISLLTLSGHLV